MSIDLTLDSLTVPGIPEYTPPFGTQKEPLESLSTLETNNNIIKPFTAQRAVEFTQDETVDRIERNAVLVFTGSQDTVLDFSEVETFKGNEIKVVNTTSYALTVRYLETGEEEPTEINVTENIVTFTADSDSTYSIKVSVESDSITTLWVGTKAQFDAIPVKDSSTLYSITDDVDETIIQDDEISPSTTWSSEKAKESFVEKDYMKKIDALAFTRQGIQQNQQPGFIRSYRIPKKIVVIGNSMTQSPYASYWQVSDNREGAASTPTSGWISLIRNYLATYVNSAVKVYKVAGNPWEHETLGSRSYDSIKNATITEVTAEGAIVKEGITLDMILDNDVDIIINQLYENIGDPGTSYNSLITDYVNLYNSYKEKSPDAMLYQFCGFWQTLPKTWCVTNACRLCAVQPILAPQFFLDPLNQYQQYYSQTGDAVYDGEGTQITTVSSTFAGHPNDKGFKVMALYTLWALFNHQSNNYQVRPCLKLDNDYADDLEKVYCGENSVRDNSGHPATSVSVFNTLYSTYLKFYCIPGQYNLSVHFPYGSTGTPVRGVLEVKRGSAFNSVTDFDVIQTYLASGNIKDEDLRAVRHSGYSINEIKNFSVFKDFVKQS